MTNSRSNLFWKLFWVVLGVILVGAGAAVTVKANVGIGAYDSLAKSLSDLNGMEVGTMGMVTNISCVVGSLLILRREFGIRQLLQVPFSILLGSVVNFVLYQILTFPFDSFIGGLVLYVVGQVVVAAGVALVMIINEVTFALEGLCDALTRLIPLSFAQMRQAADVVSVLITVAMKFIFNLPWSIGAGTLIGVVIFGPCVGFFMKALKPMTDKTLQ